MARGKHMTKGMVIDEFHWTVFAPRGLPDQECQAIRRTLEDRRFQGDLRRAVRDVARQYSSLDMVRVRLSR
jgi:hypothetical protein